MKNLARVVAVAVVLAFVWSGYVYAGELLQKTNKDMGQDFASGKIISRDGVIADCEWGVRYAQPQWMTDLGITQKQVDAYYKAHPDTMWAGGNPFLSADGNPQLPADFWQTPGVGKPPRCDPG